MPLWWNWQTRGTQNPVVAIPCRFDPDQRHHIKRTGINPVLFIYCCFGGGVRGDLSPSFVNLPLRQISAEGIPLLRETAVPESCRLRGDVRGNSLAVAYQFACKFCRGFPFTGFVNHLWLPTNATLYSDMTTANI